VGLLFSLQGEKVPNRAQKVGKARVLDAVMDWEGTMTTTTITLPDYLAKQLQQQAAARHSSVEALVIEYVEAALGDEMTEEAQSLDALVARIKAMPPNPLSIIPAQGNLAEVLRSLEAIEDDVDIEAESAALQAAEEELRAINKADDIAEGRL
jgi:plasmid stability protein